MENKKLSITVEQEFSLEDLAYKLTREIDPEDIPRFVAMVEAFCEDWEIAAQIISHFKALEEKFKMESPEEYFEEDYKPLDLLEGWHWGYSE